MSTDWDRLVENHFAKKGNKLNILLEPVREVMGEFSAEDDFLLTEKAEPSGGRFSMSIPVPKLVPTEAWGDLDSVSREEIKKIFNVFRKAGGVRERIEQVNSFLDPASARRKAPGGKVNTLLRMMQVIEALQATINDYSEASAGFVFEGFMAALTAGTQEAGRVGGTLPIEDFTTGKGENVSLKLLSPGTGIHGSFTNLVDYLFIRGDSGIPVIRYLVAYKKQDGDVVSKLAIYDFEISRDNLVDVMVATRNSHTLGQMAEPMRSHTVGPNWQDSPEWRLRMAKILRQTPGYDQKRGMFLKNLDADGNRIEDTEDPGEKLAAKKSKQYDTRTSGGALTTLKQQVRAAGEAHARGQGPSFEEWYEQNIDDDLLVQVGKTSRKGASHGAYIQQFRDMFNDGKEQASTLSESFFGAFHEDEKRYTQECLLSERTAGKGDGGVQWTISGKELEKQEHILNTNYYGELDLSQKNIDELVEIYTDKLGEDVMAILEATKEFTENIGTYFTAEKRSKALTANTTAQKRGQDVVDKLAAREDDNQIE